MDHKEFIEKQLKLIERLNGPGGAGTLPPSPPSNSGGGAYDGEMEARMTKVEIKLDLLTDTVRQGIWVTVGSAVTILLAVVTTVIATGVGIQQMTVATFQGAAQVAKDSAPAAAPAPPPNIIINVPSSTPAK